MPFESFFGLVRPLKLNSGLVSRFGGVSGPHRSLATDSLGFFLDPSYARCGGLQAADQNGTEFFTSSGISSGLGTFSTSSPAPGEVTL